MLMSTMMATGRLALLLVMLVGVSRGLTRHSKMTRKLFSSADSDDLSSSWLIFDTAAVHQEPGSNFVASNVVQQPEQRWIKPSPKGVCYFFSFNPYFF